MAHAYLLCLIAVLLSRNLGSLASLASDAQLVGSIISQPASQARQTDNKCRLRAATYSLCDGAHALTDRQTGS